MAGVSRNAFYTLARKDSILPHSLSALAASLGARASDLLEETVEPLKKYQYLMEETQRIVEKHPSVDRDNIRHTLVLLEEKPIERLRRAILRGQKFNFRRSGS